MDDNISFAMFIACSVALALYMQIQRLTKNIDANEANEKPSNTRYKISQQENKSAKYIAFCDIIDEKIRELRAMADDMAIDGKKDEFLENLSQISKKLTFVQTMNTNSDTTKWEAELFEILERIENLVSLNLKDGESINSKLRDSLRDEFKNL
ncbi:putative membrane protein [Campylobacter mucosalis]|uniref:Putative membrane protein n=1 Tax=Campylobacter mucosalis CCUG 21559 TaxID=1032067 RepID=A0A6G5QHN8_9BACT|nr:hypothetical protein [Campylobacter mucosalis]QCD45142.1 putative membrane protein [Campylobacter mucosalis CCUG 21559]QKF63058.1 putative membrane protein [Campylobacter mucosalis]